MARQHRVEQGDCVDSVAHALGLHPDSIWKDPANEALAAKRKHKNLLLPGDVLALPEPARRSERLEPGRRHRFVLERPGVELRLQLARDGRPRGGLAWRLEVGGAALEGQTDAEGWVVAKVPPDARAARLTLAPGSDEAQALDLAIGALDPLDEPSGYQGRLKNLGLYDGDLDGDAGPMTEAALRLFQRRHGLEPSGKADAATLGKLQEEHRS